METGSIRISPKARWYALVELARRASIPRGDMPGIWRIEDVPGGGSLRLVHAPTLTEVLFPAFDEELSPARIVAKSWPFPPTPSTLEVVPDFIVPYARPGSIPRQPLFQQAAPGQFLCSEDLLAVTVLLLSRFEELDAPRKDPHGRFPAAESLAVRDGYLDRPVVDEYGLALQQVLQALVPGWTPSPRTLRVKISHDIDQIGIPFSARETAGHLLHRAPRLALRDIAACFRSSLPGNLSQVIAICQETHRRGLHSALYWKASPKSPFDSGYDLAGPRIRPVLDWARDRNIELGVHPGYHTFHSPQELAAEIERCRAVFGSGPLGGRQHYLRWSPLTWAHWERCGLACDSSLGYADRVGFRAGTCWPYSPWVWNEDRRATLLEIPLLVMDRTLAAPVYMALSPAESLATLHHLLRKCRAVGGVFTLLWHNSCLSHPWSAYYPPLFDALAGIPNYCWDNDFKAPSAPPAQAAR